MTIQCTAVKTPVIECLSRVRSMLIEWYSLTDEGYTLNHKGGVTVNKLSVLLKSFRRNFFKRQRYKSLIQLSLSPKAA